LKSPAMLRTCAPCAHKFDCAASGVSYLSNPLYGKAGAVEGVSLDEMHGLRISIAGHDGKWPVSTIKFVQPG